MINHPLFNFDNDDDEEKRRKNIAYINVLYCEPGKKKVALTNQWEPEEIQTPAQLLEAVGRVEGTYELIGRNTRHGIVDRQFITLRAPEGSNRGPVPPTPGPMPPPAAPAAAAHPTMQAGGIVIPTNMDPTMAMVVSLIAAQGQQANAQADRQERASQFNMQMMTQMMTGFQTAQTGLMGTLATAFAPILASRGGAPGSSADTESGFLKGIEVMAALKEGVESANGGGEKTDWSTVTTNIVKSVQALAEVAKTTAPATPVQPIVPPGGPT